MKLEKTRPMARFFYQAASFCGVSPFVCVHSETFARKQLPGEATGICFENQVAVRTLNKYYILTWQLFLSRPAHCCGKGCCS
ncbi:hypothetical protein ACS7SF_06000 [Ralstonia sp. 25C]|uniref:hypothetical protein n=1 Tax=Ralstonia sp. 25C TaxID=3447363 RepID=UPI003F74DECB